MIDQQVKEKIDKEKMLREFRYAVNGDTSPEGMFLRLMAGYDGFTHIMSWIDDEMGVDPKLVIGLEILSTIQGIILAQICASDAKRQLDIVNLLKSIKLDICGIMLQEAVKNKKTPIDLYIDMFTKEKLNKAIKESKKAQGKRRRMGND